jgi:hypothetical protein
LISITLSMVSDFLLISFPVVVLMTDLSKQKKR